MKKYFFLTGILVWSLSCSHDRNPVSSNDGSHFAVYFLKDESLTTAEVIQRPLADLELAATPWFDAGDLVFYDFSTHCLYLKNDKSTLFEYFERGHFEPVLLNMPFVITAGGERCYLGSLHSGALATMPPGPHMNELDVWHFPKDVLHLSRHRVSREDVRSDPRVRDALLRVNLFHGGVSLELNSVSVLQNADISTVQYRLTLQNNDRDALYVIDPDLMGSELFHYYTHGVLFTRENQPSIWSEHKTVTVPSPHDSWQPSWFTRIESDQSLQRTVTLRGYPSIPKGRYSCQLTYSGPKKIERSQRNLIDGRYWIGEIESNAIAVVVD